MDFWDKGKSINLTKMVSRITAIPTSPPGIMEIKNAKAFNKGWYKIRFQMKEIIFSFYTKRRKNARKIKSFILPDQYGFSATDGSGECGENLNRCLSTLHIFLSLVWYIRSKWDKKRNSVF